MVLIHFLSYVQSKLFPMNSREKTIKRFYKSFCQQEDNACLIFSIKPDTLTLDDCLLSAVFIIVYKTRSKLDISYCFYTCSMPVNDEIEYKHAFHLMGNRLVLPS